MCCVSTLNKKLATNVCIFITHGDHFMLFIFSGSKSPCVYAIKYQIAPKPSQLSTKLIQNINSVHRHCASTNVVNKSCRYLRRNFDTFARITLPSPFFNKARRLVLYIDGDVKCDFLVQLRKKTRFYKSNYCKCN